MRKLGVILIFAALFNANAQDKYSRLDYPNVLNIQKSVESYNQEGDGYSDLGAWHIMALPAKSTNNGAFVGPYLTSAIYGSESGLWLSETMARPEIVIDGTTIELSTATNVEKSYFPGLLRQTMDVTYSEEDLHIETNHIFVSNRTSLITFCVTNKGAADKPVKINWSGARVWDKLSFSNKDNKKVEYVTYHNESGAVVFDPEMEGVIKSSTGSYQFIMNDDVVLREGESVTFKLLMSAFMAFDEAASEADNYVDYFSHYEAYFNRNEIRWNGYLNTFFNEEKDNAVWQEKKYRDLAVKCIETLMSNWKSAALDLPVDGVMPSFTSFNGFWAWDSWKHATALAHVNPDLAKQVMRSMFVFQEEDGMVPDVVYTNAYNNNLYDSKPPLASWAVWEIYKTTGDVDFLNEIYPKLKKYHEWWYTHRDYDANGLCEYGSTTNWVVPAKWESGMDNAYRFESSQLVSNSSGDYSIMQESVDLNAYLYQEKLLLSQLAEVLNMEDEAQAFEKEALVLKAKISSTFYDEETNYFYDWNKESQSFLKFYGPEGWTPLFTQVANQSQADNVIRVIMDQNHFNTYLPFPTLSSSSSGFDPSGYWYGRVWLDQAYFGIRAMQNYGYTREAKTIREKLLGNARGLMGNMPISENYHPTNGAILGAKHFSWSAAHVLLMLLESEYGEEDDPVTGIDPVDGVSALQVEVYPNPTANYLFVKIPLIEAVRLRVIDVMGQCVLNYEARPNTNVIQLQVDQLPEGIYFVTGKQEGKTFTRKIVISK